LTNAELEAVVRVAVTDAVTRLAHRSVTPGQLLSRKNVPSEVRSRAARSMLAMRGGRATAAKMAEQVYPNLVKAREALRRKFVEQKAGKAGGASVGAHSNKAKNQRSAVRIAEVATLPRRDKPT
jgi:hypothetical protein